MAALSTTVGTEWLWEALVSCRHAHSVVVQLAPADFDWNEAHLVHGTPLMATVNEIVRFGQVSRDVRPVLQWCMRQGADPRWPATSARGYSGGWGNGTEEFPHVPRVPHAGRSAITLVLGLISVLERIHIYEHKGKYQDQLAAAKQLLAVFAQFRAGVPARPVAEATVEMWESIQADSELADVELVVVPEAWAEEEQPDGWPMEGSPKGGRGCISEDPFATENEEGPKKCSPGSASWPSTASTQHSQESRSMVRAHSLVLCHASPVLRASLTLNMREGQTRVLQVSGASIQAVELLLAILYSGSLPNADSHAVRPTRTWAVGDALEANWRGRGRWWAGHVVATHDDGSCDIVYDGEGCYSERRVRPVNLRPIKESDCRHYAGDHPRVQILALDLAHRWQIIHVVTMLENNLVQQLREGRSSEWFLKHMHQGDNEGILQTFELLCEAAILKDLHLLRAACRHFASDCPKVRQHFECGGFGLAVARELQGLFD
jgi:hypothetical protein